MRFTIFHVGQGLFLKTATLITLYNFVRVPIYTFKWKRQAHEVHAIKIRERS